MLITGIERQRHNSERFSVFIDDEFAFGMSGVDILYYKLEEGMELTSERYAFLVDEVLLTKARERAFAYIAARPRTQKELRDKLSDYPPQAVEQVMAMLEESGYVDDLRYAEDYIEARARARAYGSMRIRHELRMRGVSREIIDEALSNAGLDEVSAAVQKLERKARGEPVDAVDMRRYSDYLARQGFSYEVIKRAFKEYRGETRE